MLIEANWIRKNFAAINLAFLLRAERRIRGTSPRIVVATAD
jgi:hypothetical protein